MRTTAPKIRRSTVEEYLALDDNSDTKYEYLDGEIIAMSGASLEHGVITGNTVAELRNQLRGKSCRVVPNDLRVHILQSDFYTYPDVVVVCGTPELLNTGVDTLKNPTILFEVLSPSTEHNDRGPKFNKYRQIPTLKEYILVSQDEPFVEVYTHQKGNMWLYTPYEGLDAIITLASIGGTLLASEIYLDVDFPPPVKNKIR